MVSKIYKLSCYGPFNDCEFEAIPYSIRMMNSIKTINCQISMSQWSKVDIFPCIVVGVQMKL